MARDIWCRNCGTKYVQEHEVPICPTCGSGNWEYWDYRVRDQNPARVPTKTPLQGSTEDYKTDG